MGKTAGKGTVRNVIMAGVCLALALFLPFLTGQIPQIGSMLSPMHIPVLLCGFLCGGPLGLAVGFIAPLLRSVIFGMPPMMPVALTMAFELAVYGLAAGLFYKLFPKKTAYVYLSLVLAMLVGRLVWGVAGYFIYQMAGIPFTLEVFFSGAFLKAVPGIITHIILIPPIVLAAKKAGLMK